MHLLLCLQHLRHGSLSCQSQSSCSHRLQKLNCGNQELLNIRSRPRRSWFGCRGRLNGRGDGHRVLGDFQLCGLVPWRGIQVLLDQRQGEGLWRIWSSILLPWGSTGGISDPGGKKSSVSFIFLFTFFSRREIHEVVESLSYTAAAGWLSVLVLV